MPGFNLDTGSLLAQIVWGGVAGGYLVYGWRQRSSPALVGGVVMTALTFLVDSWVLMTVESIAVMVGIYYWSKNSD